MKPGTYILHGLKYFVRLLALLALIYLLLYFFGQARVSAGQFVEELFSTGRGLMLFGALFVLAMLYPLFGFVRRTVDADITADRDRIVQAFHAGGYVLRSEKPGEIMVFRATGFKKIFLVWDDKITVTANNGRVELDGIRRETVQSEFRINTYLLNKRIDED